MAQSSRPLSPHLSVYKITLTMAMSIIHRILGVGLYLGTALILWWLVAAALGDGPLALVHWVAGSIFGTIILIAFSWALFHHMLGGLRHFVWDFGYGFSERGRYGLTWAALIGGLVLTILLWGIIFLGGGAAP